MKLGIIIILKDSEDNIDKECFIRCLRKSKNLEFCFVNNASSDNTLRILKEIKDECNHNTSLVDIKRHAIDALAVKAGARYMFNQFDLNHLGYVHADSLNVEKMNINELLETISANKDFILDHNIKIIERQKTKKTLMSRIFSVIEYLKVLKPHYQN